MKSKKMIYIFLAVAWMILSCNTFSGVPSGGGSSEPTINPQTLVDQAVSGTLSAQTQIALSVQQTLAAQSGNSAPNPAGVTAPTLTFTLQVPMVSVSVETNCRTGPGSVYDVLGILPVGQTAEVVGKSVYNDNWIIKLPSNPAITCWLWGQYATVVGDTSSLTVYNPPATPTPSVSFKVVYTAIEACPGSWYALQFKITNSGSLTWESNQVTTTDQVTAETLSITNNTFPNLAPAGCAQISNDNNLEPGESGYTSSDASHTNPAGHGFSATIKVCSQDGLAGSCLEKTITFTP